MNPHARRQYLPRKGGTDMNPRTRRRYLPPKGRDCAANSNLTKGEAGTDMALLAQSSFSPLPLAFGQRYFPPKGGTDRALPPKGRDCVANSNLTKGEARTDYASR